MTKPSPSPSPPPPQTPPSASSLPAPATYNRRGRGGGGVNMASCAVATVFLSFVVILLLLLYFTMFKPKEPRISIAAVRLPSFSFSGAAVNFTFSVYFAIQNPYRAVFSHYDSSLQLLHSGAALAFFFIPAGDIPPGRSQFMSATFSVPSFPLAPPPPQPPPYSAASESRLQPALQLETDMRMTGKIRVLQVFTHRLESKAACIITVSLTDGSVLGFHC